MQAACAEPQLISTNAVEGLLGWCDVFEAQLSSADEERGWSAESVLSSWEEGKMVNEDLCLASNLESEGNQLRTR